MATRFIQRTDSFFADQVIGLSISSNYSWTWACFPIRSGAILTAKKLAIIGEVIGKDFVKFPFADLGQTFGGTVDRIGCDIFVVFETGSGRQEQNCGIGIGNGNRVSITCDPSADRSHFQSRCKAEAASFNPASENYFPFAIPFGVGCGCRG
jgi:hypothetical protein